MEFRKRKRRIDPQNALELILEDEGDFDYSSDGKDLDLADEEVDTEAQVILDYNAIMGGVDRSVQLLKYYSFLRKTIMWYKKLALHLIDVAILHAYILYSEKQQKPPTMLISYEPCEAVQPPGQGIKEEG
ncbi:UNVERIFIED_CONTAM: hypothetical protein FKN15_039763 [Acipenser sinensis]